MVIPAAMVRGIVPVSRISAPPLMLELMVTVPLPPSATCALTRGNPGCLRR